MMFTLTPTCIGPVAAEIMRNDGDAEVVAIFERSFYVAAPVGYLCVGLDALGCGPLNVTLAAGNATPDWSRFGVTREAKGAVRNGNLFIADRFALQTDGVPVWLPPPWPSWSRPSLTQSLAKLHAVARPRCPAEGLSRLVFGPTERADRSAKAAAATVSALRASLAAALPPDRASPELARAAILMLGLGPGLTPSGDDLLGGMFLALSALGLTGLRDALWATLEPELALLTVGISAAHLAAAADGLGAAAVHATLNAILEGEHGSFPGHLDALAAIGHSSGFDTLAGIVLTLEAVLRP